MAVQAAPSVSLYRKARPGELVANKAALVANDVGMVANAPSLVANKATRHGKYRNTERRKAYMRDLMRRKRAARKAALGAVNHQPT